MRIQYYATLIRVVLFINGPLKNREKNEEHKIKLVKQRAPKPN